MLIEEILRVVLVKGEDIKPWKRGIWKNFVDGDEGKLRKEE